MSRARWEATLSLVYAIDSFGKLVNLYLWEFGEYEEEDGRKGVVPERHC
jgi:hypothetical protein